jgi:hypothetical protein
VDHPPASAADSEAARKEPSRRDYGGTDAVFADSCGNLLNLHQD